jgi:AGZA family xanthine/uracil permease-like MFS transporter
MQKNNFHYQWVTWGDLNAFFGLMLDNVSNLVILTSILVGGFGFPAQFVYAYMIPGTALGVLIGDLIYTWLAFRLAQRKGKSDVTAMPLGLDTPSTVGIAVAVLGPTYVASQDALLAWQVGMATLVFIGIIKIIFSFFGEYIRRIVPQAGLLGSLAGIGLVLLSFLPLISIFHFPLAGLTALGIIIYTLLARIPLPGRLPAAFTAVLVGTVIYYLSGMSSLFALDITLPELHLIFSFPTPTLSFLRGLPDALKYLPIAIPFGILTIIGGINVTESAKVAGDDYHTRSILLTEALSTLIAGICGGVAQTTPFIGHPAYKSMGGRAAYTLATGLFIGLGGILGYIPIIIDIIPVAAICPILIFIGLEIITQAYHTCPKRHTPAISFAFLPIVAYLVLIQIDGVLSDLHHAPLHLSQNFFQSYEAIKILAHGFILTALLWGATIALMIDQKMKAAAFYMLVTTILTLFGLIHSVAPHGEIYLPWKAPSPLPYQIAFAYLLLALFLFSSNYMKRRPAFKNEI